MLEPFLARSVSRPAEDLASTVAPSCLGVQDGPELDNESTVTGSNNSPTGSGGKFEKGSTAAGEWLVHWINCGEWQGWSVFRPIKTLDGPSIQFYPITLHPNLVGTSGAKLSKLD